MSRHRLHAAPAPARARQPVAPLARWGTVGGLLVAAALTLVFIDTTRTWEAVGSSWLLNAVYQVDAIPLPGRPEIFIVGDLPWALSITMECAVGLIIIPFLAIAAGLTSSGRFRPSRMVVGAVLGCAAVIAVNQVRIATIGWALATGGSGGYAWWHTIGGSVMSLVGIAIALLILWAVSLREPRRRPELEGAAP